MNEYAIGWGLPVGAAPRKVFHVAGHRSSVVVVLRLSAASSAAQSDLPQHVLAQRLTGILSSLLDRRTLARRAPDQDLGGSRFSFVGHS
jgi:hypothetical protein